MILSVAKRQMNFTGINVRVIGGPSGRFAVESGIVKPMNDEGIQLPDSTTEVDFYTLLQEA